MKLETWKKNGQYFIYKEEHPIFFQDEGKGEVLLLLHGFPTASWDWHKIWPTLRDRYRLIAPDFIGFGYSAKPFTYAYSILDQADLIEALMQHLRIDTVHVLAHDYGDTVLQELLARTQDRKKKKEHGLKIESVVLLNGGLFPETHRPRPIQKALISPVGLLLTPFLNKQKLKKNFHEIFGKTTPPSDQEIDEFYELVSFNRGKYIFHKLIRYMSERKQYRTRWVGALQEAEQPIRLINGGADPISGKHMVERYQDLIPMADVVIFDDIGHYPQTEAPDRLLKHYLEFRN